MKNERILDALEKVDEELIMEAAPGNKPPKKAKNKAWMKWGAMAACAVLIVGLGASQVIELYHVKNSEGMKPAEGAQEGNMELAGIGSDVSTSTDGGITIPPMEISLSSASEADMIGFFIYEGRCYVQYEHIYEDVDIVGEYLGTSTGLIDEWTKKEGYVDYAGSIRGDFYSVKGYDPEFMLCTKDARGVVCTYICNNGITLKYGRELYEDRLHLSEKMTGVQYESRKSWYEGLGEVYDLAGIPNTVQAFIEELDRGEFILCRDVTNLEGWSHMAEAEVYHMYFTMEDGTIIHLRLNENGYVRFDGLLDVCVKIPDDVYGELIRLFDERIGTAIEKRMDSTGITLEDCLEDPQLGSFLPAYIPEELNLKRAEIYYYLEQATGKETGTKEIYLYYEDIRKPDRSCTLTVTWADEYGKNGWAGPMVDQEELRLESVLEYTEKADLQKQPSDRYPKIDFGVWLGDASAVISSRGIQPEEVLRIMESISL